MSRIKYYNRRKAEKNAANKERPHENFLREFVRKMRDPVAAFTGVLALVTIGLVFVGLLQWSTLEKTDHTLREAQRAFVFAKVPGNPWGPARTDNGVVKRSFHIEWENNGNSQTRNLIVTLFCLKPQWFSIADPIVSGKSTIEGERLLGPKQSAWGGECTYTADDLDAVKVSKMHLYVAATAKYADIFRENHETRFCAEFSEIDVNSADTNSIPQSKMSLCGRNCADEECEKDK